MLAKSLSAVHILGISAYYHDSAAALVIDGKVVAAAHEERFTRKKHDPHFPKHAIKYVLNEYGLKISDLDAIVFYDKPFLKFERLLETYHMFAPKGFKSFFISMPIWIKEKLFMRKNIWEGLENINCGKILKRPPLLFSEHHLSHAASAFYASPFLDSAILTVDGVGEWATTTICQGEGKNISILKEMRFPHSLGLLYSAFTYYCGFKVNSGEYKLMGLAPYGHKGSKRVLEFKEKILKELISLKEDGSIALNMNYFTFATGDRTCNDKRWQNLFCVPPRSSEGLLTQEYSDMALAIQEVTEESMIRLAKTAKKITGSDYLVLAGGVALNCVANERIRNEEIFKEIWVQPASGDAGGALGAALVGYHIWANNERIVNNGEDIMSGSYLGPEFSDIDTMRIVKKYRAIIKKYESFENLIENISEKIADGKVVGWMQGKMEWGPRALGNRSILADVRNLEMQKKLNLKIKKREGFRPFAPSVLEEDVEKFFVGNKKSPYMLFTAQVVEKIKHTMKDLQVNDIYKRLYFKRSDIPVVTHLDYSSRIQTVSKNTNPRYWRLINSFKKKTGYGILVNTSFNVRGEPIVCTPEDAYRCFMNSDMDYLVIGNILFDKKLQPDFTNVDFSLKFKEDD